jgi:hypothetical protein
MIQVAITGSDAMPDNLADQIRGFIRDFHNYHFDYCRWRGNKDPSRGEALEQVRLALIIVGLSLGQKFKSFRDFLKALRTPGSYATGLDYANHWQPVVAELEAAMLSAEKAAPIFIVKPRFAVAVKGKANLPKSAALGFFSCKDAHLR